MWQTQAAAAAAEAEIIQFEMPSVSFQGNFLMRDGVFFVLTKFPFGGN